MSTTEGFTVATPDEARAAVEASAWTESDGRRTVHSFLLGTGVMIGADWDAEHVIEEIDRAAELMWCDHPLKHDLALRTPEGRAYVFEVRRTAVSA